MGGYRTLDAPRRVNFYDGRLLSAADLAADQRYLIDRRWLHNRLLHGSGVVFGLDVTASAGGEVVLSPGLALDRLGREIVVPEPRPMPDPRQPVDDRGQPCGMPVESDTVRICLAYAERPDGAGDPAPFTRECYRVNVRLSWARSWFRAPQACGSYAPRMAPIPPERELPRFAARAVVGVALATVALLLGLGARYGYHRDELYFLEASRHLALGYVDQPPLSVLGAWLSRTLFGSGSLLGLRAIPALLDGLAVALTGLIARELGGGSFAQAFAAVCAAVSGFLIIGHLAGPTAYDLVAWLATCLIVIRILRTRDQRLWLAAGLAVGLGLEAKDTILLLCFALAVGLLANRQARVLSSPSCGAAWRSRSPCGRRTSFGTA